MKEFVLMNRNTGDLFAAYRVALFDKFDVAGDDYTDVAQKFRVSLTRLDHDGWIVHHPDEAFGGYWIWFNEANLTCLFEILGEL